MYFEYGLDLIQVWFRYVGNPADRVATPAPPPYGQQDKLKNAHTQNLCGETVVIVAWSFWPWKSEGDGVKKLRTSSGALRKPEAEPSPRLCDQLPSKHPSRGGPHYWPRQLKPLLQPVSRCKTRQPTPAQMAKTSPWAPSSSIAPPPPRPRHPASLYELEGAPLALDLCQNPSGPALGQRKLCVRLRTPPSDLHAAKRSARKKKNDQRETRAGAAVCWRVAGAARARARARRRRNVAASLLNLPPISMDNTMSRHLCAWTSMIWIWRTYFSIFCGYV